MGGNSETDDLLLAIYYWDTHVLLARTIGTHTSHGAAEMTLPRKRLISVSDATLHLVRLLRAFRYFLDRKPHFAGPIMGVLLRLMSYLMLPWIVLVLCVPVISSNCARFGDRRLPLGSKLNSSACACPVIHVIHALLFSCWIDINC